jgi:multicomponent Na+:H+ antiporter subunit D
MIALIYLMIFLPLLTGIAIYAFDKRWVNRLIFAVQSLLTLAMGLALTPYALGMRPIKALTFVSGNWSKVVGVGFKIDGLSLMFLTMTLLAFWYIWLYIWPTRSEDHKFIFFLCVLQTALNALFTTNDLFAIFILIELVTILCSILITYKKDAIAVRAGLFYLLYNSWGMLLYLLGVICLYWYTGSMNIDLVAPFLAEWAQSPVLSVGIALIIAGLGIKSAFFMLHLWLPQAHSAAPASISAILSGLIVKMGIFVLFRIDGLLAIEPIQSLLLLVGLTSGLLGALFAIFQSDMKRILAFHTVSQLGLVFIGMGLHGSKNIMGAWAHLFNHFTFKSLLFLAAGLIIMETGERRVKAIHGLWKWHKPLAVCLAIGIISIMGFPLTSASFSKILVKSGSYSQWLTLGIYAINLGTLISFIKLSTTLFGEPSEALTKCTRRHDAVMPALYFITGAVLIALPLELWISYRFLPDLSAYFASKWLHDGFVFALLLAVGLATFKWVVKPLLKRFPHFGHKDFSFAHAMTSSMLFLWFVLEYLR